MLEQPRLRFGGRVLRNPAVRLTPSGRSVLAAGAALVVLGWLAGYPELVTIGMCCLLACSVGVLSVAGRLDAAATLDVSTSRVSRGDSISILVRLSDGRPLPLWSRVGLTAGSEVVIADHAERKRDGSTRFTATAVRRGEATLGPPTVSRGDLLGLAVHHRRLTGSATLLVRPATVPLPTVAVRAGARSGSGAPETGPGIAFDSLREYAEGDDIRRIHWPSSLRAGGDTILVRHGKDPVEPETVIVLDVRANVYGTGERAAADFETAVDVAASVAVSCASRRRPVVIVTSDGRVRGTGRGGRGDGSRLLDDLTRLSLLAERTGSGGHPARERSLALGVATARRQNVALLVMITGPAAADRTAAATAATAWCERVASVCVTPDGGSERNVSARRSRFTELEIGSLSELSTAWAALVGRAA